MNFADVGCRFFHHTDSLTLRRIRIKDLRMLCLGYTEVEIAVKLCQTTVIVGMYHLRICRIGNRIARLHKMPGIDHIFVKQGAFYKSTQLFICPAVIHCTDIGTEKSLNTKFWQITGILDITLVRIVKASRKPFQCTAVIPRKLPRIGRLHMRQ